MRRSGHMLNHHAGGRAHFPWSGPCFLSPAQRTRRRAGRMSPTHLVHAARVTPPNATQRPPRLRRSRQSLVPSLSHFAFPLPGTAAHFSSCVCEISAGYLPGGVWTRSKTSCFQVLGWKAELGLDDMCADAWRWQSQNPNGYK